jgi:broad specificity phosphatase PhoE
MDKVKNLYLIRHGESDHNVNGNAFSGITNVDLTEAGIHQAISLRNSKYLEKIEEIYTSKLLRARKTAKLIFGNDRCLHETDLLREINFGTYEGKVFTPEETGTDSIYNLWINNPKEIIFPEGDSVLVHARESYHNFTKIVKESEAENIAFVTHSTTMRLFLAEVLSLDLKYFRNLPCYNCSITILSYENESFKLVSLNIVEP